jgi:hypothetical protein
VGKSADSHGTGPWFEYQSRRTIFPSSSPSAQYEGPSNNLRICLDHFERQYLRKITPPKRLLVPKAVPTLFSDIKFAVI